MRNSLQAWWQVSLPQWIAWWLPKSIVRYATIRLFSHATVTDYTDRTPDQVSIWDALKAWR